MVHHSYANYLMEQIHREHDLIAHLFPNSGESYLNCSIAYFLIGNCKLALEYAEKAENYSPVWLPKEHYEYFVYRSKLDALANLGRISEAALFLDKMKEIIKLQPLSNEEILCREFETILKKYSNWDFYKFLSKIREKYFNNEIIYSIPSVGIKIFLPPDWKIGEEIAIGTANSMRISSVFSSQVSWDSVSKSPIDASIDFLYSSVKEDLGQDLEKYGLYWLNLRNAASDKRLSFKKVDSPYKFTKIKCLQWHLSISPPYPKRGKFLLFGTKDCRISLGLTYELCGENTLLPLLDSIEEKFINQKIFE